jgi:hypothetical protein
VGVRNGPTHCLGGLHYLSGAFWIWQRDPGYAAILDNLLPNLIAAAIVIFSVDMIVAFRDQRKQSSFRKVCLAKIPRSTDTLLSTCMQSRILAWTGYLQELSKPSVFFLTTFICGRTLSIVVRL